MNWRQLQKHDWIITIISLILMGLGLAIIYSTTYNSTNAAEGAGSVSKQIIIIIIALIAYFAISTIDLSWLQIPGVMTIIYAVIVGLLLYVRLFGTVIAGTNRWINIGFFSLQPAEYAKIVIILLVASIFAFRVELRNSNYFKFASRKVNSYGSLQQLFSVVGEFLNNNILLKKFITNAIMVAPIILLIFIQPAFGNSIISLILWLLTIFIVIPNQGKNAAFIGLIVISLLTFFQILNVQLIEEDFVIHWVKYLDFAFFLGMIGLVISFLIIAFLSRINWRIVVAIPIISLIAIVGGIYFWNNNLQDYQKQRVLTFFEGPESPDNYATSGYQVSRSKVAIGSGRLFGRGYLLGIQSGLKYLPQAYTDFIFAAYVEQFGLVGAVVLFFLYLLLILRIIKISLETGSDYGRIVCVGTAVLLLLHIFINIGMNLGQLPVTGIPLPLVSYGGSAVLMIMICLGLVQAVNSNKKSVDSADNLMLTSRSLLLKNT